jgi:hypothetical protein
MYVPGEAVSLKLSLEHLPQPTKIIHSRHNPGGYAFGKEMVRAVIGISLVQEAVSGLRTDVADESLLQTGDRVKSVKHGLGVVRRSLPDGRLEVVFDDGYSHMYRNSHVISGKISRAQDNAPQVLPQPTSAGTPTTLHTSVTLLSADKGLSWSSIKPKRNSTNSFSVGVSAPADIGRLLLYLNKDTWKGPDGAELEQIVRTAWEKGVEIVMVHENDPTRNGCEFGHFFQTTPRSLIDEGIYKSIAIALHTMPHREVSLSQVAQACGAIPSKKNKVDSLYLRRLASIKRNSTQAAGTIDLERLQAKQIKQFETDDQLDAEMERPSDLLGPTETAPEVHPSIVITCGEGSKSARATAPTVARISVRRKTPELMQGRTN